MKTMTMNMDFSQDRYGIEIEFGSCQADAAISEYLGIPLSLYCDDPSSQWNIGYDDSVQTDNLIGYELRTSIWSEFPHETLEKILSKLKNIGTITPTCGLHFHFSGPSYSGLERENLKFKATRLFQLSNPHKEREHFCTLYPPVGSRSVLRQIYKSHWECRCFNGTFEITEIKNNFERMRRVLCQW